MPLVLRDDFDAAQLRLCARQSDDAGQVRRLLALAAIYDGASRAEAAEIGGVTRQIVRDWVQRLNTRKAPGKSPLLTPASVQLLPRWSRTPLGQTHRAEIRPDRVRSSALGRVGVAGRRRR